MRFCYLGMAMYPWTFRREKDAMLSATTLLSAYILESFRVGLLYALT